MWLQKVLQNQWVTFLWAVCLCGEGTGIQRKRQALYGSRQPLAPMYSRVASGVLITIPL